MGENSGSMAAQGAGSKKRRDPESGKTPAPERMRPTAPATGLDAVDLRIVNLLQSDARMPNNAVAAAVGIAPSTCHGRIKSLQERGVIREIGRAHV